MPVGVGVLARVEPAFRGGHFAPKVGGGFAHGPGQLGRVASSTQQFGVDAQEQALVVEHFLEMRNRPIHVHAIAMEAAGEVVEETTASHFLRAPVQVLGDGAGLILGEEVHGGEQEFEIRGGWEFRCGSEAAMLGVRALHQKAACLQGHCGPDAARINRVEFYRERGHDSSPGVLDFVSAIRIGIGQGAQDLAETRHAVPRFVGVIGSREKGAAVGQAESGERPAAAPLVEANHGIHVDLVYVGAFLAVHLDADEMLVHERRRGLVLEGFALHHVTPMAGAVADGDQQWTVEFLGAPKRLGSPGIPVHRVLAVLEQICARLVGQAVACPASGRLRGRRRVQEKSCPISRMGARV